MNKVLIDKIINLMIHAGHTEQNLGFTKRAWVLYQLRKSHIIDSDKEETINYLIDKFIEVENSKLVFNKKCNPRDCCGLF